jgi:hypothetical protein
MIMQKRFINSLATVGITAVCVLLFSAATALAETKMVDKGATWVVEKTTSLTGLTIADGATVKAPEGSNVTLSIDGAGAAIKAGDFKGKVVLTVTKEIKMGSASGGAPGGGAPGGAGGAGGAPGGGMPGGNAPGGAGSGAPGGASGGMPGGSAPGGGAPGGAGGGMPGGAAPGGAAPGGMAMPGGEMPGGGAAQEAAHFKAAVYVENGKYVADKSVAAVVAEGKVTDSSAADVKITSSEGKFNGIIVTGDKKSSYSITNPVITLTGNGGDDATGLGDGIVVSGKADVTIKNAKIKNTGANRSAVFVSGEGIAHIDDSDIETFSGPKDDTSGSFNAGGVMMAGPWLLGITGNVRATNIVENGTAYYTNTHIKSQAWGALSTDGPTKIRLYATKCVIEAVESGYGTYSIGDCINTFKACTFNVADYGIILCDNSFDIVTDGTVVNSKRIGVMMHTGTGGGQLTIDKGSVFNTKDTVIQIKGRGIDILVDNAKLNTQSGVILQSMANDDPFFAAGMGDSMGAKGFSKDVNATFKNVALNGDIINSYTAVSPVNVKFENASITGAITTGTAKQPLGPKGEKLSLKTPELYYLIGQTMNTYEAKFQDPFGVSVSLDAKSTWTVGKTSWLTSLSIADGAKVIAPTGYKLTMTVDGVKKGISAGSYKGRIVMTVEKI